MDENEYDLSGNGAESQEIVESYIRKTGYTMSYFMVDFVKKHPDVQFLYGSDWKDRMTLVMDDKRAVFVPGIAVATDKMSEEPKPFILSLYRLEIYAGSKMVREAENHADLHVSFKTCIEKGLEELEGVWFTADGKKRARTPRKRQKKSG